ncbi:MAG TPA: thiamine phosphate synthase [Candidatus Methylacidiphilales bacterium]
MSDLLLQRRVRLQQARLYGILDLGYVAPARLVPMAQAMIEGGCDVIQLRAKGKTEAEVLDLAHLLRPLFIVNDHPEAAKKADADGVHIGQDDGLVPGIRARILPDQLVGKSSHSVPQAVAASDEGADYIGVGPLYATPTKPDYVPVGLGLIKEIAARVSIPRFCIGGIKRENLDEVLAAGADRVVVVSGILQAPDPAAYCRDLKSRVGMKGLLA